MRKKNYKGRCEKKSVPKCNEIFKAYDAIQNAYVDVLSSRNDIVEIRCNVPLEDMDYTSDFLCIKTSGEMLVRECLYRKLITKPIVIQLERWWIHIPAFISSDIFIVKQRKCKTTIFPEMG